MGDDRFRACRPGDPGARLASKRHPAGIGTFAAYLLAWIGSYHGLFALRESVELSEAWREAAPWLPVAAPACVLVGLAAALSHKSGLLGDVCLALPIAWSLPEVVDGFKMGLPYGAALATLIVALSVLPFVGVGRRDARMVTVLVASAAVLGGLALASFSVVLSQVHS